MSVNIKVTGGLNIEWGQIDPKVTGGLKAFGWTDAWDRAVFLKGHVEATWVIF